MAVCVGIIVKGGKGYIPTQGQTEAGFYLAIKPVYTVDLTVDDMVQALGKVIAVGHPKIPTPTQEEWKTRDDPILEAVGVGSWRKLAKDGASYTIEWQKDALVLYISCLDRKGRFEADTTKTRTFSRDTYLRIIVEAILDDIRSRPELLEADSD